MSDNPFSVCGSIREAATAPDRCELGAGHQGPHSVSVPLDAVPTSLVKTWAAREGDDLVTAELLLATAVGRMGAAIDALGEDRARWFVSPPRRKRRRCSAARLRRIVGAAADDR